MRMDALKKSSPLTKAAEMHYFIDKMSLGRRRNLYPANVADAL